MMEVRLPIMALALAATPFASVTAHAQSKGDQLLLDALVRKGILTNKEAEDLETDLGKSPLPEVSSKITVDNWVKEAKISGDLRIRNQWDERDPLVINKGSKVADDHIQRDRWRFRLRLNLDAKLANNFFGGVQLSTSDNRAADTKNATYTGGYDNANIYITRAFMGWAVEPGLTFIVGKQANPFYTTDLVYDTDIEPTGLVERVDFNRLFDLSFGRGNAEKAALPIAAEAQDSLQISLIAGQFIFEDNAENSSNTQLKWDAYQFQAQFLTKWKLGKNLAITVAPGVFITNDASVGATTIDPKTGKLVDPPLGSLNNSQPFPLTQRDLFLILVPGDVTYKIYGKPLSLYWDFAYNFEGDDRFQREYGPLFTDYTFTKGISVFRNLAQPSFSDNLAWLVGMKYGGNEKGGDWSVSVDWRQQGISSIDPNINNSNFALSNLNSEGWEFSGAYSCTDFLTFNVTFYLSDALTKNLFGGHATQGMYPIARDHNDKIIQANLVMKF